MSTRSAFSRRGIRGVSLIEALVAMAIMAFGMLGVVGMQAALRSGADQSKQRSEAVRLAQEAMETFRSFGQTTTAPVGELTYALIATQPASAVTSSTTVGYTGNATFDRSVTVIDHVAVSTAASSPRMKTVTVDVTWADRGSSAPGDRSVTLRSVIAEISPQLGGSLGVPTNRSAPQRPGGRHPSIPRSATPGATGESNFDPPGTTGVRFVFDNSTGLIKNCTPANICPGGKTSLLSGYIRFATGVLPTGAEAEIPPNAFVPSVLGGGQLGVRLDFTLPPTTTPYTVDSVTAPIGCYVYQGSNFLQYFCAVPLTLPAVVSNGTWSGTLDLILPTGRLAVDAVPGVPSDVDSTRFRVCRYTPDPMSNTPPGGNDAHPLLYTGVSVSLTDQNFLIISAGDDTVAYGCPTDNTATLLVDGDTKLHQPRAP
jgi:Tfp pilus assembly protein PilV